MRIARFFRRTFRNTRLLRKAKELGQEREIKPFVPPSDPVTHKAIDAKIDAIENKEAKFKDLMGTGKRATARRARHPNLHSNDLRDTLR